MKNLTKLVLITTTSLLATAWLTPGLQANMITGSIGFNDLSGVQLSGGSTLATVTSFTLLNPTISTETGIYTAVPLATAISFTSFQFNPPVAAVTPVVPLAALRPVVTALTSRVPAFRSATAAA